MIKIRAFGFPPVVQSPPVPLTEKQRLLLLLLAGTEGPLRRSQIARLLWPRSSSSSGRHSLSQCLYALRSKGPEDLLSSDADLVSFAKNVEVDTHRFLDATRRGEVGTAANLYCGPFGEGIAAPDDVLDEWLNHTRERFYQLARDLSSTLLDHAAIREALELTERLLIEHPFDEDLRRRKIELLSGLGKGTEAAVFFQDTQRLWKEEFDSPWPFSAPGLMDLEGAPLAEPGRFHFVGRRSEMSQLRMAFERSAAGSNTRVLLVGEPGIGKTSLAERFRRLIAIKGGRSLWSAAHPLERNVPFGIVSQWLAEVSDGLIRQAENSSLAALPPEYGTPAAGRQKLYAAVADQLLGHHGHLCLFLDDLQWADDLSLGFIGYLSRRAEGPPVLFVGTLRSDESPIQIDIAKGFDLVRIHPLQPNDIVELLQAISKDISPTELDSASRRLHQRTGGNPLLLAAFLEEGTLGSSVADEIPSSILEFVEPRLEKLSIPARTALAALAVLGKATARTIAVIADLQSSLDRALDELLIANFVEWQDGILRPRHGLIADLALSLIGPVLERQLRGRAARTLHEDALSSPATVAVQYDLAGQRERAFEAAVRAAGASVELFAHQEAEYFLKVALANAPSVEEEVGIRFQLADVHLSQGKYVVAARVMDGLRDDSIGADLRAAMNAHRVLVRLIGTQEAAVLREARDLLSRDAAGLPVELHARLAMAYASAAHGQGREEDTREAIDLGLRLLPQMPPSQLQLRIGMRLGVMVAMYRSAAEAISQIDTTIRQASMWPDTLALGYAARGSARVAAGEAQAAEEDLLLSLQLMESTRSYDPRFMASNNLGVLYQEQGRYDEALQLFEYALNSKEEGEVPAWTQLTLDNLSILSYETGDCRLAIERADHALSLFPSDDISTRSWFSQKSIKGLSCLEMGRLSTAYECKRDIEAIYRRSGFGSNDISYVEIFFARMAEIEGEKNESIQRLRDAAETFWPRDFFCAARMEVERLRLICFAEPAYILDTAPELRKRLAAAGARPLVERLDLIVARASVGED